MQDLLSIDTGIALLDAIINNPLQTIALLAILFYGHKFLFSREGYLAEERSNIKWRLKWKLEDFFEWLDRRDKAYQEWEKKLTSKQRFNINFMILTFILIPMTIYNIVFTPKNIVTEILIVILLCEYLTFVILNYISYRKRSTKHLSNTNTS